MVLSLNLNTFSLGVVPFYRHLEKKMDWQVVSVIIIKLGMRMLPRDYKIERSNFQIFI